MFYSCRSFGGFFIQPKRVPKEIELDVEQLVLVLALPPGGHKFRWTQTWSKLIISIYYKFIWAGGDCGWSQARNVKVDEGEVENNSPKLSMSSWICNLYNQATSLAHPTPIHQIWSNKSLRVEKNWKPQSGKVCSITNSMKKAFRPHIHPIEFIANLLRHHHGLPNVSSNFVHRFLHHICSFAASVCGTLSSTRNLS